MNSIIGSACCTLYLLAASIAVATDAPEETIASRPASQQEYWAQADRKDWGAAIVAAQALVAEARRETQTQPLDLVRTLSMLGNAQMHNADLAGAESSFTEALALAERIKGAASRHTLDPLRGLGFTLASGGRHQEALPYLDRALLISHRTHGLFHIEQQAILRQLASSLTLSGQPLVAERHVRYMLQVGQHAYGEDDPRLVPLMCAVGDWHAEVGNFDDARRLYRDGARLIEDKLGKNDIAIVRPLRRLAASFTQELAFEANGFIDPHEAAELGLSGGAPSQHNPRNPRYIDTEGQRALLRSLAILKSNPDASPQLLIDTLVDTGDWYQTKDDFRKALPFYSQAAQVYLQHADQDSHTVQDRLAFPVRVYYPVPNAIVRGNKLMPHDTQQAFVQMEFTVTAEGLVKDAKIVETDAHNRHASEILSAIRDARFRPKFLDGEPVETVAMSFREVFRIRKRDDEDDPS
jgi:tetratricopeptide (TPR) repeat protein